MHRSLSSADRKFIAEQIEPITRLPVNTAAEEEAWHAATRAVMERLETRFPDVQPAASQYMSRLGSPIH